MAEIEQSLICDGVNFRSVQDTRFKTMRIAVSFILPIKKDTAAANALLPFLLSRASREYPDFTKLSERLAELYGAALNADIHKLGETQVLSVCAVGLADRYALEGENISMELSRLLCSVLFDPPFVDGLFPEHDFEQERRQTVELIDSEFNDKRTFAKHRCEEVMCEKEAFGINRYGSREAILALTRPQLTAAWENVLRHARVEIMVLGDCNPQPVFRSFQSAFQKLGRTGAADCRTEIVKSAAQVRDVTETMSVAQSKLVLGFRAGAAVPEDDVAAVKLMTAIFGGTPHSKLFLNVREKLSLCYYCAARYDWNKGIILVESGVENQNIEKAKEEILFQLDEIRKGNFDDDEIRAAKMSLCNSYRTVGDFLGGLENWYVTQAFCKKIQSPEEAADAVNAVTREQIIAAAQRVALDTVYRLVGSVEESA